MAKMTLNKLYKLIAEGRGQGHRDEYKPWLQVCRRNPSARGNQVVDVLPGYLRPSHFMARVEAHVALLCLYLGAWDVREQFPLWPVTHWHPLADLPEACSSAQRTMRGLIEIAEEAGIAHGQEIGSKGVPYVATVDLAVTLKCSAGARLAAISLKPHAEVRAADPTDRLVERLELERRYFAEAEAHHSIVEQKLLGKHTGGNLEMFSSGARLPMHLQNECRIAEFCGRLIDQAASRPIGAAIDAAAALMSLSATDANLLWRHGVWHRRIELDVTRPVRMDRPIVSRGKEIRAALSVELFGEVLS